MSSFSLHLLSVNLLGFILMSADGASFYVARRRLVPPIATATVSVLGGAAGVLLGALALQRDFSKAFAAWRTIDVMMLIGWAGAVAVRTGTLTLSRQVLLSPIPSDRLQIEIGLFLLVNAITAALFYLDKGSAEKDQKRVPEFVLLMACLLGGATGGTVAMHVLRHKTKRWYFYAGLPAMMACQIVALLFLKGTGML